MIGFLVAALFIGGAVLALMGFAPEALDQEHNQMSLVFYLCWLILMGSAIVAMLRGGLRENLRNAVIWILLAIGLVAGYSVRHELKNFGQGVLAALVPGLAIQERDGVVRLRQGLDGHFYVRASVEGKTLRFLVDTGASLTVLSASAASDLGIDYNELDYSLPVSTANGDTFAAPIKLRYLNIGGVALDEVAAAVMRPGQLDTPLLGMSFLGRLSAVNFEGDTLILRR